MISIRRTLLAWLLAGLGLGIGLATVTLYLQAREQANTLFDYQMEQLAASLPNQPFSPIAPARPRDWEAPEDVVIQIWDNTGTRIYYSHEHSSLPQRAKLGFSDVRAGNESWRVYSTQLGNTVVQVAQPMRARRDIAAATALRTAAPLLALLPLLAIVVWVAVSKGLAPLRRITRELQARDADALSPLGEADLPEETRPLVGATNALLQRLRRAIEAQRSFIADAAHELRTPLTALRLQAQIAARAQTDGERQSAFADLQRGLDRSTRLVEQLLTLARQEPGAREAPQERFDLAALARSVVSDLAVLAAARGIDLGITRSEPAFISGSPDAVRILLSNLVDNALRYAHAGGRVDLAAEALDGQASVIIEDTGPGVPAENLGNLFERFFRVPGQSMPGSGLGLAIVKKIADAHHAEVGLENTGTGLRVTVRFPAAPMPAKALLS